MTESIEVSDFVPAVSIYRRAVATAKRARTCATEYEESGRAERRLREIDAAIEAVILAQAAAEGWIHAAYRSAGIEPRARAGWAARWVEALPAILGPDARELDRATVETLDWIGGWRNYLAHDDARARARIRKIVEPGEERNHLTADFAEEVIRRMDDAFTDIAAAIGWKTLPGLHSDHLWTSSDEV